MVVGLVERGVDLEEVGGVNGGRELFGHVGGHVTYSKHCY